jgi:hypothetical protein
MAGYPLRFEHQVLAIVKGGSFTRETASSVFESILIRYGVEELRLLLSDAAKAIMHKLSRDSEGMQAREDVRFYEYRHV